MNCLLKNVLMRSQRWCQMQSSVKKIVIKSVIKHSVRLFLTALGQHRGDGLEKFISEETGTKNLSERWCKLLT